MNYSGPYYVSDFAMRTDNKQVDDMSDRVRVVEVSSRLVVGLFLPQASRHVFVQRIRVKRGAAYAHENTAGLCARAGASSRCR